MVGCALGPGQSVGTANIREGGQAAKAWYGESASLGLVAVYCALIMGGIGVHIMKLVRSFLWCCPRSSAKRSRHKFALMQVLAHARAEGVGVSVGVELPALIDQKKNCRNYRPIALNLQANFFKHLLWPSARQAK